MESSPAVTERASRSQVRISTARSEQLPATCPSKIGRAVRQNPRGCPQATDLAGFPAEACEVRSPVENTGARLSTLRPISDGQVAAAAPIWRGNPNLPTGDARSVTAGLDFIPLKLMGWSVLDYFNISSRIGSRDRRRAVPRGDPALYAPFITRNPTRPPLRI